LLVFAQQQAWRYQKLAKEGWGTVQNEQQCTSQLHQQESALQTALENLNQARRQAESLKAQHLSAEATLRAKRGQAAPSAGGFRAHAHSFSSRRLREMACGKRPAIRFGIGIRGLAERTDARCRGSFITRIHQYPRSDGISRDLGTPTVSCHVDAMQIITFCM
jgi:hypothetical protein